MKVSKYKFLIFMYLMILFKSFNSYFLAETKHDSIIKLFCMQSVKQEMINADIEYNQEIVNETCECYYEEFIKTASHQVAKTKCKLETQESLNHSRKI